MGFIWIFFRGAQFYYSLDHNFIASTCGAMRVLSDHKTAYNTINSVWIDSAPNSGINNDVIADHSISTKKKIKKNDLHSVRSQAVKYGDTVYLSGALGLDVSTGKLVEGGAGPETTKALENVQRILEASQSSFSSGWSEWY